MPDPTQTPHRPFSLGWVVYATLIAAAVILGLLLFRTAATLALMTFAGVLAATVLRGISDPLAIRTGLHSQLSVALVGLALVASIVASAWLMAGTVGSQIERLTDELPNSIDQARTMIGRYTAGRWLLDLLPEESDSNTRAAMLGEMFGFASGVIGVVGNLLVMLVVAAYLAAEPGLYLRGLIRLIPPTRRDRAADILSAVGSALRHWMAGKVISMAIVGVASWAGLWLLDVPLAFTLGLVSGILAFVPNFGPLAALVLAALVALSVGPQKVLEVTILFAVIQFVESWALTPLVQRRQVHIPQALLIVFQVLAGVLLGVLGLVLATPLLAALIVVVEKGYVEDALGDTTPAPGSTN